MVFVAQIISWVNVLTNAFGRFFLSPIAVLPGWLSNAIISAVTGVCLLVIFKYTSNQNAIGKIRDNIKANLLALKLFRDSISVTLHAEVRIFKGALLLLVHAIPPMLVMIRRARAVLPADSAARIAFSAVSLAWRNLPAAA